MNDKPRNPPAKQQELHEQRKELHGQRRKLHERLSEVCEDFVLGDLTREHKQKALMRELQYLLDYYQNDQSWEGVE
jgi:hypothetical protein